MTIYEIISLTISALALLVSIIVTIFFTRKSNTLQQQSNKLQQGQAELEISKYISDTKNKVLELTMKYSELPDTMSKDKKKLVSQALNTAIENNLNAYEEACAKYLDNKIDKKRFEKNYRTELRNLLENKNYNKYFDPLRSNYKAILKVYDEWENLEK